MSEWEDVFGAGFTFEQFERRYLRGYDRRGYDRSFRINKGDIDRKKRLRGRKIVKKNEYQIFNTYDEAIKWAKKNPERSFRYSKDIDRYVETTEKHIYNRHFLKEKP